MKRLRWMAGLWLCLSGVARAELYYYKDVLIGERASGLGGAFAAISDDPSGIYYNPGGLAFGLENYLNISANAFQSGRQTYENIYPGQNYVYRSQAFVPSFFGFSQTVGKGKFGFGVIVPNADDIDQDDQVTRPASPGVEQRSFIRKISKQDTVYLIGPAYAREIAPNLSLGVSALALVRLFKFIDNTLVLFDPVGTGKYFLHQAHFNQSTFGGILKLGMQYMPAPKWSLGLVITKNFAFGGSGKSRVISGKTANGTPITLDGTVSNDLSITEVDNAFFPVPSNYGITLAAAYFLSRETLLAFQADYHGPQSGYSQYPIRGTVNWSLGAEHYLAEWFALRFGAFTNNTNTRPVVDGGTDQAPHVNQLGTTLAGTIYRSGTSISLGAVYTYGIGRGQAFASSVDVQRVRNSMFGVYFAGSYQL